MTAHSRYHLFASMSAAANAAIVRRIYTPNTVSLYRLLLLFRKGRARLTAIAAFLIVSAHTRFLHDFIYEKT